MLPGVPPVEAEEARVSPPRERYHGAWVLALARWLKAWAERMLAEHDAALVKEAEGVRARVRSLPLREPVVTPPPPVPAWLPRLEGSSDVTRPPPVMAVLPPLPSHLLDDDTPTPRPNTLRCLPRGDGDVEVPLQVALGPLLDFDPDDLLPSEPGTVVARPPLPASLLQAAAIPCDDLTLAQPDATALGDAQAAQRSLHVVPPLPPGQPARELLVLLREPEDTPTRPSVPWLESTPPTPSESAEAEEVLRECERLELETQGE
ncbi:hypothetical protein D7V97_37060 [Corallococcus sp. CA053C]|uniref:hypothetical protein n=1 Tax=Corallococcus sp. CA053C TaxID=2316732 RepID=UPI000EA2836D|nr:hypothetical protein [Corallococcus sp. CA053C]RKG95532.1 hypothetical protein D7V97_37060 [Corallococcus sp. CA053C]